MRPARHPTALILSAVVALSGCEVDYYAHLVGGELASLANSVPVENVLRERSLDEAALEKLSLTQQVRRFAIDRIGLVAGEAFTVFERNGAEPAAYVLSASAKDSLTPFQWNLLLLGISDVKGYFDEAMARREADRLSAMDLDVFLGRADGFSTLGIFPDPVRESNLRMDEIDLAEFILHELTHSTVIKPTDTDFNESLASFVGRRAAQAWFDETFGADSAESAAAQIRFADEAIIDEYINALFDHMTRYYSEASAQGASRDEIIAGRDAAFETMRVRFDTEFLPRLGDLERWSSVGRTSLNNATLLAGIRYQGTLSDYARVLEKAGSFPRAVEVYQQAALEEDSRAFLRSWLTAFSP